MISTVLEINQIIAITGLYLDAIGVLLGARTFSTILFKELKESSSELIFTIIVGILALAIAITLKIILPHSILSILFVFLFAAGLVGILFKIQQYKPLSEILALILIVTGFLFQIIAITI